MFLWHPIRQNAYGLKLLFSWFILVAGAGFTQSPTIQKAI
jgi:hypothetical protein